MPRVHTIQTNFTAGEVSPRLLARVDVSKYENAVETLENMTVAPHGGAVRRPGTRFVAEVKDSTRKARLWAFEFSTVQAYILEFGHLYCRFYKDRGRIESPPGTPVEITTQYDESELFELSFAQSADVLYIAHPDHPPRKLTRSSHTSWSITDLDFLDGPYLAVNTDTSKTLTPSATTGTGITITASGHSPFVSSDVGRLVRIKHGSTWGYAKITAYTSATQVTADVKKDFGGTTASSDWRLGAWSATTGYPATVTFFQERLWWGGNTDQPQTLWGSVSGDFENYQPSQTDGTVQDDDAVTFTIADDRVNAIRAMSAGKRLAVFTTGGEFTMAGGPGSETVTPTAVQVTRETTHGAARLPVERIGPVVLFLQRQRRKLREFVFNLDVDSFKAPDLTLLAEHVTGTGVVDLDYQREPDSVLWAVRDDGTLLGMTYERDQDVVGWHRHVLGGRSDAAGAQAKVESVAVIPGSGEDEVWVTVQRRINGATKRYVEFIEQEFDPDTKTLTKEDAFFVDSGLTLDSPVAVTGATQANPVVVTAPSHGFANGDSVKIRDIKGMTELNGRSFTVANATADTFELQGEDGTGHSAYISGGTARKEVTAVTGLSHLEGETVSILADGAVHPDKTVSGGQITLDRKASIVHAGLRFTSKVRTLRPELQLADGTAQGRKKRVAELVCRFWNTLGAKAGPDDANLDVVVFRSGADPMDASAPLFTGDKRIDYPGDWDTAGQVTIVQDQPLPMTLLAVIKRLVIGEG